MFYLSVLNLVVELYVGVQVFSNLPVGSLIGGNIRGGNFRRGNFPDTINKLSMKICKLYKQFLLKRL